MKRGRYIALTVFAIILLAVAYAWLTWLILPDLGIVHLVYRSEHGHPLPQDGYVILGFQHSRVVGHRLVESIDIGWPGVRAAWPYVAIGIAFGLGPGYLVGEWRRRKQAKIIEAAIRQWHKKLTDADRKEFEATNSLLTSIKLDQEREQREKELDRRAQQMRLMQVEAQQILKTDEETRKQLEAKERELSKARDKIRRLEAKIRNLEKSVDEPE